ncbi:MAG: hypothetical protein RLZ09_2454 [Pseudomonadota bacterium]
MKGRFNGMGRRGLLAYRAAMPNVVLVIHWSITLALPRTKEVYFAPAASAAAAAQTT